MTSLAKELKILVIVDENVVGKIERYLEKLSSKFGGKLYLIYMKDVDYYPSEVLLELEKKFNKIREETLNILNNLAEKAKSYGFNVEMMDVHIGISSQRLAELYKRINPDILVDLRC